MLPTDAPDDLTRLTHPLVKSYFEEAVAQNPRYNRGQPSFSVTYPPTSFKFIRDFVDAIKGKHLYSIARYLTAGLDRIGLESIYCEAAGYTPLIAAVESSNIQLLTLFAQLGVDFSQAPNKARRLLLRSRGGSLGDYNIPPEMNTPLYAALLTFDQPVVTFVANHSTHPPSLVEIYYYVESQLPLWAEEYKSKLLQFIAQVASLPALKQSMPELVEAFARWEAEPAQSLVEEFLMWKNREAIPDSERTPLLLNYLEKLETEGRHDARDLRSGHFDFFHFSRSVLPFSTDPNETKNKNLCEFLPASATAQRDGLLLFLTRALVHDRVLQVAQALQLGVGLNHFMPAYNSLAHSPNRTTTALLLELGADPDLEVYQNRTLEKYLDTDIVTHLNGRARTPFNYALIAGNRETAEEFIAHGIPLPDLMGLFGRSIKKMGLDKFKEGIPNFLAFYQQMQAYAGCWQPENHASFPLAQRQRALTLFGLWNKSGNEYKKAGEDYERKKPYQYLDQLPAKLMHEVTKWMMS